MSYENLSNVALISSEMQEVKSAAKTLLRAASRQPSFPYPDTNKEVEGVYWRENGS